MSTTVKPVTQTELVDVKIASIKEILSEEFTDFGKSKNKVPKIINTIKLKIIILDG